MSINSSPKDIEDRYEIEKKERRQLRGRQRSLQIAFLKSASALTDEQWKSFANRFDQALSEDIRLDPHWIDTERYLLALYNIFTSMGFNVHFGPVPRVSGVEPNYRIPIFAYNKRRAILIENRPSYLFTDLADIQPLCPLPVVGLSYNSVATTKSGPKQSKFVAESILEARRLASALALGHLTLSSEDLREAISAHPERDRDVILSLANRLGLLDFLHPPIDALPVFGQQVSTTHELPYDVEQFLRDAQNTATTGSEMSTGNITQAKPDEAIADPEYYFKELKQARLINQSNRGNVSSTTEGLTYLRTRVLPFPLGQLLHYTCLTARDEVRNAAKSAFIEAVKTGQVSITANSTPLYVTIDDIDSFVKTTLITPNDVKSRVPVENSESEIKSLFQSILKDSFIKADWGGEQNDILTSRVILKGKRIIAAFFLKGPSVKGRLTLAKCGKNGDQIQRLFQSPADAFFVQFNGEIDERVIEECRQKTRLLRSSGKNDAFFCIVDGLDTARLLAAYQDEIIQ